MRKRIVLGSLAALGLMGNALAADGFSYSYIEAKYLNTEFDDIDIDGDGFRVDGSMEFSDNVHGFVGYSDADLDGVDLELIQVGIGGSWPLKPSVDLVGRVSYLDGELSAGQFSADDSGYGLELGVRGRATDQLELTGSIERMDIGDFVEETFVNAGAAYYFNPAFAANVNAQVGDDVTIWTVGLRYDFGKK